MLLWPAAQLGRAWRLGRDGVRILGGVGRSARGAVVVPVPAPALARLEGEALARVGTAACYRVRVHNPTAATEVVALTMRAEGSRGTVERRTMLTVAAGTAVDRWFVTRWAGDADLVASPIDTERVWEARNAAQRWTIEARVESSARGHLDRLVIGGGLIP